MVRNRLIGFSAKISRTDEGTMILASSILALAGPDPTDCEDGVAAKEGCFRSEILPPKTLQASEVSEVEAVFEGQFSPEPNENCRDIADDPCRIGKHA